MTIPTAQARKMQLEANTTAPTCTTGTTHHILTYDETRKVMHFATAAAAQRKLYYDVEVITAN
jgi:hypothetical protein